MSFESHRRYQTFIRYVTRELIPPITAFLEEDLKLVHTGGNLTPGDGVGSRRSFRIPTQKLTVVKPRCYQVTRLTSRISPNKTPEKSYFNIFVSRWQAFQTLRHPPSCLLQTFVIITTTQQLVRNIFIGWLYFYQPMRIMLVRAAVNKTQDGDGGKFKMLCTWARNSWIMTYWCYFWLSPSCDARTEVARRLHYQ